jgi:hypothetical protein
MKACERGEVVLAGAFATLEAHPDAG